MTPGGGFPGDWDCLHFCLIAFAKVIPMLVKNLLNRDDMDFVFLYSTPSVIIELGAEDLILRDVNSFKVFHRPEGLFLFSFIRFLRYWDLHSRTFLFTKQRYLRYADQCVFDWVFCAFFR